LYPGHTGLRSTDRIGCKLVLRLIQAFLVVTYVSDYQDSGSVPVKEDGFLEREA
jgi:hypothetical protein